MKRKEVFDSLVTKYDKELDGNLVEGHSINWYQTHLEIMIFEIMEIKASVVIFNELDTEIEKRALVKKGKYSLIRSVVITALPYRIVMGLSKIFVGKREMSLERTINWISQQKDLVEKTNVRDKIEKIRDFLGNSPLINNITVYRDCFFGHLDNDFAMSDIRIAPWISMNNIEINEIEKGIELIKSLYHACFEKESTVKIEEVSKEEIIRTFFG